MRRKVPWAIVVYVAVAAAVVGGIFLWDHLTQPPAGPTGNDPAARARAAAQSITGQPTVRRVVVDPVIGRVVVEATSRYFNASALREDNRQYLATEGRLIAQLILHDLPEIPQAEVDLFAGRRLLATITGRPEQQFEQYAVTYEGDLAAVPAQPAGSASQVIIGMGQEPSTLNPLFADTPASAIVLAALFVQDVGRNPTGQIFAQGVEALPSLKAGTWRVNGEEMTLTWTLKARRWHDGEPVTCDDYVFAHAVARDPRVPVARREWTNRIARVDCPAGGHGLAVAVVWKERYPYANLAITEYGALPRHRLELDYRQHPATLGDAPYGHVPQATIGDGAYRLVEWRRGVAVIVESVYAHPIFGTPKITRIIWHFVPDSKRLTAELVAGTIDAISTVGLTVDDALQLARDARDRIRVSFEPGLTWEHLDLNVENPMLEDVRVRRAIAYAIDRTRLVQELFHGTVAISQTYLPPAHPGYTADVVTYPYDQARARGLLREAGFVPGPDGILRNTSGQRLALTLVTTAGDPGRALIAQRIRDDVRQVGIALTIQTVPPQILFGEMTHRRKFSGLALYAWAMTLTADCAQLYTSDGIPSEANGWTGENYTRYKNTEMDRICTSATREIDPLKRIQLLKESAQLFSRDLPAIPLFVRVSVSASKADLQNFAAIYLPGVAPAVETWNVDRWAWKR